MRALGRWRPGVRVRRARAAGVDGSGTWDTPSDVISGPRCPLDARGAKILRGARRIAMADASNPTMDELVHVDRALARRILGGDEAAFRELFDRFFPRLYRFALARLKGDPDAARDIVQQTFCRAIEKLDSYRGEAALYTWFCQICR